MKKTCKTSDEAFRKALDYQAGLNRLDVIPNVVSCDHEERKISVRVGTFGHEITCAIFCY